MEKTLKKLIEITTKIEKIYKILSDAEFNNNISLYNEYSNYLKLLNEVEDNIYNKLNITTTNADKIISQLLNYTTPDENIFSRIASHIDNILYINPFISTETDPYIAKDENMYIITIQFFNDYIIKLLKNIKIEITNTKDTNIKYELIKLKNNLLYRNKIYEYMLSENIKLESDGRNKCIIFNHNKQQINNVYINSLNEELNKSLVNLVQITNETLKKSKTERVTQTIELIYLKSAIELLTDEERKQFDISFSKFKNNNKKVLIEHSSNGYQKILKLLNTTNIR